MGRSRFGVRRSVVFGSVVERGFLRAPIVERSARLGRASRKRAALQEGRHARVAPEAAVHQSPHLRRDALGQRSVVRHQHQRRPFPHDPEVGPVAYETSGGFLVFKQDDAAKRDMVMEFARFLTNTENAKMLETLMYITARRSANEQLEFATVTPYLADVATEVSVYQAAIDHGIPYYGPSSVDTSPAIEHFTAAMEAALSRSKTPQQALDDFVAAANRAVFGR